MLTFEKQGAVGVVRPKSPIDAAHAEAIKTAVLDGVGVGRPMIVVDMHESPLIDSAGLETLLELREALEAKGGAVKLADVNSLCADILRITGVGQKFEQYAQVRSAVGSFAE